MTVLLALLAVAAVSWLFRISFTALLTGDRLPPSVRSRLDAVSPAAFAALLAAHLADTPAVELPAVAVAVVVAGIVAWRTRSHLAAVLAAGGAWGVLALL